MARKSPLDKVLGKLEDLDEVNLSNLVQRLARERKLLETVFDVIRDGILVLDESGVITYSNQQEEDLLDLSKIKLIKSLCYVWPLSLLARWDWIEYPVIQGQK